MREHCPLFTIVCHLFFFLLYTIFKPLSVN